MINSMLIRIKCGRRLISCNKFIQYNRIYGTIFTVQFRSLGGTASVTCGRVRVRVRVRVQLVRVYVVMATKTVH